MECYPLADGIPRVGYGISSWVCPDGDRVCSAVCHGHASLVIRLPAGLVSTAALAAKYHSRHLSNKLRFCKTRVTGHLGHVWYSPNFIETSPVNRQSSRRYVSLDPALQGEGTRMHQSF